MLNFFRISSDMQLISRCCLIVRCRVVRIRPLRRKNDEVKWAVSWVVGDEVEQEQAQIFDGVALCNGHHRKPSYPPFYTCSASSASPFQIHSHDYRHTSGISAKGKKVVVVGMGKSGSDIAEELLPVCSKLLLCSARWKIYHSMLEPSSSMKFDFEFLDENGEDILVIKQAVKSVSTSSYIPLYQFMMPPSHPTLAIIALMNVEGSLHPVAEAQGKWFAQMLSGRVPFPTEQEMRRSVKHWEEQVLLRPHNYRVMEVEPAAYIQNLLHRCFTFTNMNL
ncbi:dimethylaniline monooxygenase N-oxide-forming [Balamuthia mandrillaris]